MKTERHKTARLAEWSSLFLALALVLYIAIFSYHAWDAFARIEGQALVTLQVVHRTTALLSSLKDAETGQRGFLLTGEDRYLEPYRQALAEIRDGLNALTRAEFAGRADHLERVNRLKPLVKEKLDELEQTIELRRSQRADAAVAMVRTDRGIVLMDQIRALCAEIQKASNELLERARQEVRANAYQAGLISTLGSAGVFALLVAATVTIQKGTRRREQLIESLQESEKQTKEARDWLHATITSIGDAVIATNPGGKVVFINNVAESLTGWTQQEAVGRPLEEIFMITHEDTGAPVENPVSKALREGRPVGLANHTRLTAKDGRHFPIDDSAAPIRNDAGEITGVVLVFRNITERKKAEEALQRAMKFDEAVMANMGEGLYTVDTEGLVTFMNPAAEKLFGWRFEELRGRKMHDMTHHHHRDGRPFPAEECSGFQVLKRGRNLTDHEDAFIRKDGTFFDVIYSSSPLRSGTETLGLVVVFRDVSEQKRAAEELRQNAGELRRANEDLNQFAFATSHDLQEPLRMITSYSQLLIKGYRGQLDGEAELCVNFITDGTKRMRELLADLLAYTRVNEKDGDEHTSVDLNLVFQKTIAICKAAIDESQALITSDPLPVVSGFEPHFLQVFQNLIGNAIKYRGERAPRIHVSATRRNGVSQVSVADNGIGIAPAYHQTIFGVFKRLHGRSIPGTGIGLAICQRVVNRYGGRIWVESEVNQGATFYFTLPAAKQGGE